jgi:coenzyme F420-dependent glucose-6-phosphate dehydrogenase
MQYWFSTSTEEFTPSEMLEQAKAAERAGFDGLGTSDHFAPWFPGGEAAQAWVYLGALGQATQSMIGTGVTPIVHHYHPGLVAQAFMSLEELYPGRVFLGVGSGESVNETPLGMDWPSYEERRWRLETGLDAITRLWDGETVTMDAGWFKLKDAKLWTRAKTRPKLYVSAFGPQSAQVAARFGDGLWTLGDPDQAPQVVEAYRAACSDLNREPGEIIFHAGFAWAGDDRAAIEGARHWKPTQLPEVYVEDIADQEDMQRRADRKMTDEEFAREGFLISADPAEHVERIREMEAAGATVICLQLIGQADPFGSIRTYGERVLPALRRSAVGA